MTQEEKAKRYDEALKVLHKYDGANIMFSQSLKEEMFPELKVKESEDERMKKLCISVVKQFAAVCRKEDKYLTEVEKCITWLEKQGKNNMGISEATKQKLEDNLNKALEQETPYSWNDFLKGEQKSTWSEEDERIYKVILELMDSYSKGTIGGCIISPNTDRYIKWFKSLRPQNTWKPSDKQMQALSDAGNSFRPFEEGHKILWSLYNDLKKLREEQL